MKSSNTDFICSRLKSPVSKKRLQHLFAVRENDYVSYRRDILGSNVGYLANF